MNDKQCINLLLCKNVDLHQRFNQHIEEIVRKGNGRDEVLRLIESIRFVADDMDRVINRN